MNAYLSVLVRSNPKRNHPKEASLIELPDLTVMITEPIATFPSVRCRPVHPLLFALPLSWADISGGLLRSYTPLPAPGRRPLFLVGLPIIHDKQILPLDDDVVRGSQVEMSQLARRDGIDVIQNTLCATKF
jgi:hypothetical protein